MRKHRKQPKLRAVPIPSAFDRGFAAVTYAAVREQPKTLMDLLTCAAHALAGAGIIKAACPQCPAKDATCVGRDGSFMCDGCCTHKTSEDGEHACRVVQHTDTMQRINDIAAEAKAAAWLDLRKQDGGPL